MKQLQKKRWDLWKGLKLKKLSKEEAKELSILEKTNERAKVALGDWENCKTHKFEPMDGTSTNVGLERWFEELPNKNLTEKTVWNEFAIVKPTFTLLNWWSPRFFPLSPRDRVVNEGLSLRFSIPVADNGYSFLAFGTRSPFSRFYARSIADRVVPFSQAVFFATFVLYYTAACFTDRALIKSETTGSVSSFTVRSLRDLSSRVAVSLSLLSHFPSGVFLAPWTMGRLAFRYSSSLGCVHSTSVDQKGTGKVFPQ